MTTAASPEEIPTSADVLAEEPTSEGHLTFGAMMRRSWPWLLLLIPYLLAWYAPFLWSWPQWGDSNHPQFIQPWIPILALILVWARRDRLISLLRYSEKHPPQTLWERGNILPLTLGCLLYLFAHLVQIKGVAVAALLLIAFGTIFALYGGRFVKSLRVPFLLCLLMIPPPDTAVDKVVLLLRQKMVTAASLLLNRLHFPNRADGWVMHFENTGEVVEFPNRCGGASIAVNAMILLFWYALLRRRRPLSVLVLPMIGLIVALAVNLLRVAAAGATAAAMPEISRRLIDLNTWVWTLIALMVTVGLDWLAGKIRWPRRTRTNAARTTGAMLTQTGRALSVVTVPFDYLFKWLGVVGTLWRRSEKAIERLLKRLTPKRKSRGRRR